MSEKKTSAVRWDDLAAFLAIARTGGLSSAAAMTGLSAPTLGRRMHALERVLGRELFLRRTHGYDLTEAGLDLRRELESVAGKIERATTRSSQDVLPVVKVSAGSWTTKHLIRNIHILAGKPPDTRFRFLAAEDFLSINRREAVIGLRNKRPSEPGLAGLKLNQVQFAVYARSGASKDWIQVTLNTPSARWVASLERAKIVHEVNHPQLALDMALMGLGQVVLPTFIGDCEGGLERISSPIDELSHDQWLVTHDDDRALPEVRRTIDRVALVLGKRNRNDI